MLNDSYTLGTTTAILVYTRQFADENKSVFSVAGLAANASRKTTVSHQPASTGRCRSMIDLSRVDVNPSSSAGATEQGRLYIVLDRPAFLSEAECQADRIRLKTLVDDAAFWTKFCNREV